MAYKALDYQIVVKRLITLPFLLLLMIILSIYTLFDLTQTVHREVKQANKINFLLAQSTASGNANLITNNVNSLLDETPQFENIVFYPFNQQQSPHTYPITLKEVFFEHYYGLSQPVKINLANTNEVQSLSQVKQLIGYINLTLDLQYIRQQWFVQHLPLLVALMLIGLLNLWYVLFRVQHLTNRLSVLENLSHHILKDQYGDAEAYFITQEKESWIFEKALIYLLAKNKALRYQIESLHQQNTDLQEVQFKQNEQSSKFENILIHEFKSSVSRIESGLQLLQNQYISSEQKDAVEIISLGKDDLNTKLDQIIQINRIDKGQTGVSSYQFSPTALITQIVEQYQPYASQKNLVLTAKTYHSDYVLEGDIQKITLIISSLIENAIKFTDKGSITIISQLQHLLTQVRWTVRIEDTGIGIASKHLNQIFEPFFQVNPEIKHTSVNSTVGLFLVKKLVNLMHGEVTVTSEPDIGTTFGLSFFLKDWKNNYHHSLLKSKQIIIWQIFEELTEFAKILGNTGSQLTEFTNVELLEDYCLKHNADALFISYHIKYEEILDFVNKLRESESNHRILIYCIYDYKKLNAHSIEKLKIAGVDYFIPQQILDETPDQYIKDLANILN